ncbi:DegT/DnrJ/EryC1/StrS family aminotransferase [Sulfitobacter sp.]|uniref:DegT/DnrJ/EryC1/StrS family aminotransferase n=1 Tax=Sulfitobacter sp. TaxID=1903071 RepID=UPI00262F5DA1|nr:DegT/DnrJ/EryC1/StrS family aminotransferase [Sulfitobacter sp.]
MNKKIFVTQPFLPDLEEFTPYLEQIWQNKQLTNNGPFHRELEQALCDYLNVEHLSLFSNGTIALVTALQALRITGEVITTPYSFVATAHSLLWNKLQPVFADIEEDGYNIDPDRIEEAITDKTSAIMPVHVYGRPCAVERIQNIADKHGLKVIYDAAHAFGVQHRGQSLLSHGDMSALSFHATKVFNTFEGGCIISKDAETKQRVDFLKNFGFADEVTVTAPGINGKMSEINAAFGLLQLKHIDNVLDERRAIEAKYRTALNGIAGIRIIDAPADTVENGSYFPILVDTNYPLSRDALYEALKAKDIYARRYFYPLITDFPMYRDLPSAGRDNLPIATRIADSVISLPLYPTLANEDVARVIEVIADNAIRS